MLSNKKLKKRKQPFLLRDDMDDDIRPKVKKKMPKQKYRHQQVWIETYEDDFIEED